MFNNKNQKTNNQSKNRINEQIRCPTVMLLQDEQNLGIFTSDEARKIARETGLDLVEISPTSKPPVCRIMDYGKFKYEQGVKEKEKKKKQKTFQEKELHLSPSIGENDLMIKINAARKFLEKGFRVFFVLKYKKRENAHKELGYKIVEKIVKELEELGVPQTQPRLEGSSLNCIIEPKSK
jgi:translation initiation factor IF-3